MRFWYSNFGKSPYRGRIPPPTPSPRSVASLPRMGHRSPPPPNRENKSTPMCRSHTFVGALVEMIIQPTRHTAGAWHILLRQYAMAMRTTNYAIISRPHQTGPLWRLIPIQWVCDQGITPGKFVYSCKYVLRKMFMILFKNGEFDYSSPIFNRHCLTMLSLNKIRAACLWMLSVSLIRCRNEAVKIILQKQHLVLQKSEKKWPD